MAGKHNGRNWLENSAQANFGQYPASATTDEPILCDGQLIRKATEVAVIRYKKKGGHING